MKGTAEKIPAIELRNITKTFASVVANEDINLTLYRGEILALLGENGSGKTTLMNILAGIYKPDSGSVLIDGEPVIIHSPEDANKHGIGMIHQHFKLVEVHSAADNIILGDKKIGMFLKASRHERIKELCNNYHLQVEPDKKVYNMSVSEKQTVEILKVLYRGADILILDEPTAVLTPQEADHLFDILRHMRDQGCAIIIITHKLDEVMSISDRVTILHKGKSVATVNTAETNAHELTELMVGKAVELSIQRPPVSHEGNLLEIHHLSVQNEEGVDTLRDVSFDLNHGEILGVAGLAGSGQKELCETIAGLLKPHKGAVLYKNENIIGKTPAEIIKIGISMSFVPEDRLGMGLAASMSLADNLLLKSYKNGKGPFLERKGARALADSLVERLEIVTPDIDTPVRRLSGGNVQKVLLGREIESNPNVLITAYPVRGLDINSSYTIYDAINQQKEKGVGILFIGEDLDVMLELCDRIMVLCHGRITGIVDAKETTKEKLGLMMADATIKEMEGAK
ncbi:MAG: ABC transporter ATP-binding protein [Ruminococcaceae bacterium]|nr:ABC transporter ATP-binding protein [Oscillospiraceae bacterium]